MKEPCHRALSFPSGREIKCKQLRVSCGDGVLSHRSRRQPGWRREAHFIVGTDIKPAQARGSRCGQRCVPEAGLHLQHVGSRAPCALRKDAWAAACGQLMSACLRRRGCCSPSPSRSGLSSLCFLFFCCSSVAERLPDAFLSLGSSAFSSAGRREDYLNDGFCPLGCQGGARNTEDMVVDEDPVPDVLGLPSRWGEER